MKNIRPLRLLGVLVLAVAVALVPSGCAKKKQIISGTVTCDGKPVKYGQVVFYAGDVVLGLASIAPDGSFHINADSMPDGELQVAINTGAPIPVSRIGAPPGSPDMPTKVNPGEVPPEPPKGHQPPPMPKKPLVEGPKHVSKRPPLASTETQPPPPDADNFVIPPEGAPGAPPTKHTYEMPTLSKEDTALLKKIQSKYGEASKSGLSFNKAKAGETYNIELQAD